MDIAYYGSSVVLRDFPAELTARLSGRFLTCQKTDGDGHIIAPTRRPLHEVLHITGMEPGEWASIPFPLWTAIRSIGQASSTQGELLQEQRQLLGRHVRPLTPGLTSGNPALHAFIASEPLGIIAVPTRDQFQAVVHSILAAFPFTRTTICVATHDAAHHCRKLLCNSGMSD